jgi:hypothetical protein
VIRHSKLGADTARRDKVLGHVGERLASDVLARCGFTSIRNLNREKNNFPFADLYAERNSHRYVISVKIRNKFEVSGRLNARYKLGANCYELAERADREMNAEAAWLAIALEPHQFSAYFGLLAPLGGNRGIPMTAAATSTYECLAHDQRHDLDYASLKNVYVPADTQSGAVKQSSSDF